MLGYYTVAGTLALIPLTFASPIALALFPRFTELVALKNTVELVRLYHRTCEIVAVVIIPLGLTIMLFAWDFIFIWTGSAEVAQRVELVAIFLLGGQLMQATAVLPYYLCLAHGNIRLNLQMGIASVVLITPLLIFFIMKYDLVGAGVSWLIMNLCTIPAFMYLIHHKFLPGEFMKWSIRSVTLPLLTALPCVLIGRWLIPHTDSRLLMFFMIMLVWSVAAAASILISPALRQESLNFIKKMFGNSYVT